MEAIERVERAADPIWIDSAVRTVVDLARSTQYLTTDEVWEALNQDAREPRAMGAVMLRAAKLDIIEKTDRVRNSTRAVNHSRPIAIWKSRVYVSQS